MEVDCRLTNPATSVTWDYFCLIQAVDPLQIGPLEDGGFLTSDSWRYSKGILKWHLLCPTVSRIAALASLPIANGEEDLLDTEQTTHRQKHEKTVKHETFIQQIESLCRCARVHIKLDPLQNYPKHP
jgi:hypothetical protein